MSMTSTLELLPIGLRNGIWTAQVTQKGTGVPQIEVLHLNQPVQTMKLTAMDEGTGWAMTVEVPKEAISDGVQTFTVVDKLVSETIGDFTLLAGEVLSNDIRAEVDLLRAELDMLKRAFRRHCVETS